MNHAVYNATASLMRELLSLNGLFQAAAKSHNVHNERSPREWAQYYATVHFSAGGRTGKTTAALDLWSASPGRVMLLTGTVPACMELKRRVDPTMRNHVEYVGNVRGVTASGYDLVIVDYSSMLQDPAILDAVYAKYSYNTEQFLIIH